MPGGILFARCLLFDLFDGGKKVGERQDAGSGTQDGGTSSGLFWSNAPMQQPLQQGTGAREALVQVEGLGRGTSPHTGSTFSNETASCQNRAAWSNRWSQAWNPGARRCGVRGVPLRASLQAWKGPLPTTM